MPARRDYTPMLATLADARPARRRLDLRGEVRRLPRARLRPRRRVQARLAQRQRPDGALLRGREGARQGGEEPERCRRRRGLRARRRRAGRASRSCSREAARSSTTHSTCSSSTAGRSSTLPLSQRKERLRELLDRRVANVASPSASTTATRCSRPRRRSGLEGIIAKRAESAYKPGRRSREWLKLKTHGRQSS